MKEMLFLSCKDKIILGPGEKIMVSFPEGWVYMYLNFIPGPPPSFEFITITGGKKKVIKLKNGKSALIFDDPMAYRKSRFFKASAPKEGLFLMIHDGTPPDLL